MLTKNLKFITTPPTPHNSSNKEIDATSIFVDKPLGKSYKTQRQNHHSSNKIHQINTLIPLTETYPKPTDTTPNEAEHRKIMDSQRQALDKVRHTAKILKGKLYQT